MIVWKFKISEIEPFQKTSWSSATSVWSILEDLEDGFDIFQTWIKNQYLCKWNLHWDGVESAQRSFSLREHAGKSFLSFAAFNIVPLGGVIKNVKVSPRWRTCLKTYLRTFALYPTEPNPHNKRTYHHGTSTLTFRAERNGVPFWTPPIHFVTEFHFRGHPKAYSATDWLIAV